MKFNLNTTGWSGISVRFDYKAWDPTTTSFDLNYRLSDTADWSEVFADKAITADNALHGFANTVDNQSFVQFRFNDLDQNGNDKFAFDNFELTGTQIPEPATILLLGLGIAAFGRNRRK